MSREWTQSLYSIALDASVRAVLLAGVVGLILGALRIRSSGVRYAAWRAVLCAMLLMPALPYFIPSIAIPLRISPTAPRLADAPARRSSAAHVIQTPEAASSALGQSKGMSSAFVAAPAHTSIWALGLIAYASGVLVLLFRLLLGWRFMKRILDSSVRAGYAFLPDIALYESRHVAGPVTVGVLFPKIVLPVDWKRWPEEKVKAVLAHERAHAQRRDPLIGFIARVNCSIFWFHPLAWWLERRLAATAEHACDDAAVRATSAPHQYAELLLDIAGAVRRNGGRFTWQGIGVEGNGLLDQRIDRILRGDIFSEVSRTRKAIVAIVCTGAIFFVAACRQKPEVVQRLNVQEPEVRTALEERALQTAVQGAVREAIQRTVITRPVALRNPQQTPTPTPTPPAKAISVNIQVDFIKITEDTVMTPITVHVANRDLTFQDQDGFQTARGRVIGEVRTISGRLVQKFEDEIAIGPFPAASFKESVGNPSKYQKILYLRPGLYNLTLLMRDVLSGNNGTATLAVSVPRFTNLATSSLILADAIDDLPSTQIVGTFLLGDKKVYPNIAREFRRDGTLNAWLQTYGLKIDPTTQRSSATLDVTIGRDGNAVEKTFTLSNVSETATFTQSFPLTDFDPGVYSIQIKITDNVAGESTVKSGGFIVR